MKRKHSKKPVPPQIKVMRTIKKELESAKKALQSDQDGNDGDLLERIIYWLEIDCKSHWDKMNSGKDVKKDVEDIKARGSQLILDFNLRR